VCKANKVTIMCGVLIAFATCLFLLFGTYLCETQFFLFCFIIQSLPHPDFEDQIIPLANEEQTKHISSCFKSSIRLSLKLRILLRPATCVTGL